MPSDYVPRSDRPGKLNADWTSGSCPTHWIAPIPVIQRSESPRTHALIGILRANNTTFVKRKQGVRKSDTAPPETMNRIGPVQKV
jgi:hypothetical protein